MRSVLVTRPLPEAEQWAEQLRALDIPAVALPLIDIRKVQKPELVALLAQARAQWHTYNVLMFVSGNAVTHFFSGAPLPPLATGTTEHTRFWSPGPGTAKALIQAGVPEGWIDGPAADSEQFDSESLWLAVRSRIEVGSRVLIVRGAHAGDSKGGSGREWLAEQILAAGGTVDFVAAYERLASRLSESELDCARAAVTGKSLLLFSSSEAITHLCAQMPQASWRKAHALVTHPRIAQKARATGFGCVSECRPTLQDVAVSIKSHL